MLGLLVLVARLGACPAIILATLAACLFTSGDLLLRPNEEATVWAIPSTKVYHCPRSRWYGKTEEGKYMGECEAIREGFRPAFGNGCGSSCNN